MFSLEREAGGDLQGSKILRHLVESDRERVDATSAFCMGSVSLTAQRRQACSGWETAGFAHGEDLASPWPRQVFNCRRVGIHAQSHRGVHLCGAGGGLVPGSQKSPRLYVQKGGTGQQTWTATQATAAQAISHLVACSHHLPVGSPSSALKQKSFFRILQLGGQQRLPPCIKHPFQKLSE